MKLNLYSTVSTLALAHHIKEPKVKFVITDNMRFNFTLVAYEGFNPDFEKEYPLQFAKNHTTNGYISYVDIGTLTPFTDTIKQTSYSTDPIPETSMVLRSRGVGEDFGLSTFGLSAYIIADVNASDIATLIETINKMGKDIGKYPANLAKFNDPAAMEEDIEQFIVRDTPYNNENIRYVVDSRYDLACYTLINTGREITQLTRDGFKETTNLEFQPNMPLSMDARCTVPIVDNEIIELAERFYKSTPDEYKWLEAVTPLDMVTGWMLEMNKPYKARALCRLSPSVDFSDIVSFEINDDYMGGRVFVLTTPNGEQIDFSDINLQEPFNSALALIEDAKDEALAKGASTYNVMDFKRGLRDAETR